METPESRIRPSDNQFHLPAHPAGSPCLHKCPEFGPTIASCTSVHGFRPAHNRGYTFRQAVIVEVISKSNAEPGGRSRSRSRAIVGFPGRPLVLVFSFHVTEDRVLPKRLIEDYDASQQIAMGAWLNACERRMLLQSLGCLHKVLVGLVLALLRCRFAIRFWT